MVEKYIDKIENDFCFNIPIDSRIKILLKREFCQVYKEMQKIDIIKLEKPRLNDDAGWIDGYYQHCRSKVDQDDFSIDILTRGGYFVEIEGKHIQNYNVIKLEKGLTFKKGEFIGKYKLL